MFKINDVVKTLKGQEGIIIAQINKGPYYLVKVNGVLFVFHHNEIEILEERVY
jgi:hypothetical protein